MVMVGAAGLVTMSRAMDHRRSADAGPTAAGPTQRPVSHTSRVPPSFTVTGTWPGLAFHTVLVTIAPPLGRCRHRYSVVVPTGHAASAHVYAVPLADRVTVGCP